MVRESGGQGCSHVGSSSMYDTRQLGLPTSNYIGHNIKYFLFPFTPLVPARLRAKSAIYDCLVLYCHCDCHVTAVIIVYYFFSSLIMHDVFYHLIMVNVVVCVCKLHFSSGGTYEGRSKSFAT